MTVMNPRNIDEVALGAFFEDIGKFMQRAFGSSRNVPAAVKAREGDVLPPDRHGGYTHKHALWTDAFFEWMEGQNLAFPRGIDANRVRDAAVYHHSPRTPLHWLSAVADRLSAGMDRKAKDEAQEVGRIDTSWDAFRRVPLACIFDEIYLGIGKPSVTRSYDVSELTAEAMFPRRVDVDTLPRQYEDLWGDFGDAFCDLCNSDVSVDHFHEGLISLSERFTWSIPSSTIDQPDVSLHDHNRTVAAFASCLYRHHEKRSELDDESSIKDNRRPRFRILTGDLSGIQPSLFRLRSEGVKGANRILRARSFLMGQIAEAGALICRRAFDLPPYCMLQNAGGRFQLLIPEIAEIDDTVSRVRTEVDGWMLDRFYGDLVLNLAVSPAFSGADFKQERFAATQRRILATVEEAKQRPLNSRVGTPNSTSGRGVIRVRYPEEGACQTCGTRPAAKWEHSREGTEIGRCPACDHEEDMGSRLPKAVAVSWRDGSGERSLFDRFHVFVHDKPFDHRDPSARRAVVSGWRVRGETGQAFPVADRFVANHVPRLASGDGEHDRYGDLSDDAKQVDVGDAKLFEHLAADAREWVAEETNFVGRAMLSVVKADVDRLGFVFGFGLADRLSVGRAAQLSRMLDAFFTGFLDHLVRTEFPNTYTVYSGGDDVLMVAPWFDAIKLARRLRSEFGRFVNGNPNITLSAAVEFVSVDEPLNRAVRRAEEKLERAKDGGRDRVTLVGDHPLPWTGCDGSLDWALDRAEWLNDLIRRDVLPTTFLYRMLSLDRQRRQAEDGSDPSAATWRSRWAYHLGRLRDRLRSDEADAVCAELDTLMCGKVFAASAAAEGRHIAHLPDPRVPLTIALYRNR